MIRILIILNVLLTTLFSSLLFGSGLLFNVESTGQNVGNISITLCLNGKGPISCQNYTVPSLNLNISTTIPNHIYSTIGIRVNTQGFTLATGCTPISNGFCIFTASKNSPQNITLTRTQYYIVFDAGSSGSRVYVYQVKTGASMDPIIVDLYNEKNSNPLASCTTNIDTCLANALQGLIDNAKQVLKDYDVKPEQTIASVLGTAGMRLITPEQQEAIYQAVRERLQSNHFIVGETRTITGQQEGLYQWLDVNYLSNTIGLPATRTYGLIEMGGASSQVAFVINDASDPNVIPLTINGRLYNLYSISFLGLGKNQAREAMNALSPPAPSYCFQNMGAFTLSDCLNNFDIVLGNPLFSELSFITSFPEFSTQIYYGIDNIYSILQLLNTLPPTNPPSQSAVETATMELCSNQSSTSPSDNCANFTYLDAFLYASPKGLKFDSNATTLIPVDTINGVKVAWTLGYTYLINKVPKICDVAEVC